MKADAFCLYAVIATKSLRGDAGILSLSLAQCDSHVAILHFSIVLYCLFTDSPEAIGFLSLEPRQTNRIMKIPIIMYGRNSGGHTHSHSAAHYIRTSSDIFTKSRHLAIVR